MGGEYSESGAKTETLAYFQPQIDCGSSQLRFSDVNYFDEGTLIASIAYSTWKRRPSGEKVDT